MKNIYNYIQRFSFILPVIMLLSCEDEDTIRVPDLDVATNFRIVRDVSSFDSTDPDASVTFTIYSESNNIQEADMYVSHFSLIDNAETRQFPLTSVNGSEITNDGTTKLTFSLNDLTAAMNKTPEELAGGDAVNIYSIVTLTDGRIYPDTIRVDSETEFINVTPNIVNSSATTSFSPKLIFPILCAIEDSFGTGSYLFEVIEGSNDQFGIPTFDESVVVEITALSSTERTFDIGYLSGFGFGATEFDFTFACNVILLEPTGAGLGCGGGGLAWDLNKGDPGQFDITDDSQFTVSILHNIFGDCGIGTNDPIKFRLTKQ
ncbi:MAG: hypothetical protein KFF73_02410 [Cyclobacteriaceae bacterium]|nr:hypothetical protein [Cyclobacteriaceae bacterium]